MKTILVTGSEGFIGRNLIAALKRRSDELAVRVTTFTSRDDIETLQNRLREADIVFHLAGANRPPNEHDFQMVNTGLTEQIVATIEEMEKPPVVVISSSTQAERDNPYGRSKLGAENALTAYHERTGNPVSIYRLPNVFGKWSRPNYNTVVATFCHNISRGLDIQINDPSHQITLVYIDEVVRCFLRHVDAETPLSSRESVDETFDITVGELADKIREVHAIRQTLKVPDLSDRMTKYLYSTYLSFLDEQDFAGSVDLKVDDRGWLFELIKSDTFGQMFVSTTKPGITRGNHYHDTKVEKFCLIHGEGIIRFRLPERDDIVEYPVNDQEIKVVDIPPGYTHSIENTGSNSMIVLFWANEVFDPNRMDTYWVPVIK
ncbi:MAG: NAD-dependent epimerase/dehydratase family protein [Planctomycetales bacterium]|nr:NAD-dependent epimerase/dehydratase family protein [Planctomycetales bacterium]